MRNILRYKITPYNPMTNNKTAESHYQDFYHLDKQQDFNNMDLEIIQYAKDFSDVKTSELQQQLADEKKEHEKWDTLLSKEIESLKEQLADKEKEVEHVKFQLKAADADYQSQIADRDLLLKEA